jgi:hypothetical protein
MKLAAIALLFTISIPIAFKAAAINKPEVRTPRDGQHIGEPGDPLCEDQEPCAKVRATGWATGDRTPIFLVAPVKAAPRMWIQPRIIGHGADGTFSGLVNLGESHNGARQWFKIFVLVCSSPNRFAEGEEITEMPSDCDVSEPVEVFRER